jgi:hypothetical protein
VSRRFAIIVAAAVLTELVAAAWLSNTALWLVTTLVVVAIITGVLLGWSKPGAPREHGAQDK